MTHHEMVRFLLAIAVLLLVARGFGELARRVNQPAVLGEILAGILLGPTVFGALAPALQSTLFPTAGNLQVALSAVSQLSLVLFLLVAGLEVDLSSVLRQGRQSLVISFFGMVVPFGLGFAAAWLVPQAFGAEPTSHRLIFALFLGTALSISALPVIAKTLLDLGLYRSDLGMVVVATAVVDDITGWILFAIILGMLGGDQTGFGVPVTIGLTLAFAIGLLTVGRWLLHRVLPLVQAYTPWPGGVLSFATGAGLLCAAFTEWIGIHAIFGAFLFGVALGDSTHLREKTRHTLENFISFIFAPLFFASIGLKLNFATHFDPSLVLAIIAIAFAGKILGCGYASRLAGFSWRESWAIGFGMNARGAMGNILALLALNAGLIGERMFVALVVMALVTSMVAGGAIQRLLRRHKSARFFDYLASEAFVPELEAETPRAAIDRLCQVVARGPTGSARDLADRVWAREELMPTGIGEAVAIPHARIPGLSRCRVALGFSRAGIDFDAPDGELAHVVILILTPDEDSQAQLDILADISRTFSNKEIRDGVLRSSRYVELMAALKAHSVA